MKHARWYLITSVLLGAQLVQGGSLLGTHTPEDFGKYWYTDGAEISRYALSQARYGELHEGDAILIFVTEKLRPDVQVKADHPTEADLPILKLNAQRKFYTGLYPYSVMTSVFSPVDPQQSGWPVKITTSAQEWCGHVYVQMNLRGAQYDVVAHSYFETEGDQSFEVEKAYTEDGLFTLLRIAPDRLPVGAFSLVPSTLYSRLLHCPLAVHAANGNLEPHDGMSLEGNPLARYTVTIPALGRTLEILFERDFPHRVERWQETNPSLRMTGGEPLTTVAQRTHTIKSLYWNHNANRDRALLETLGLKAGD